MSTPSSMYRYQVVCPDGLPDVELTLFADDQMEALSPSSVPVYLREILSLINWSEPEFRHWRIASGIFRPVKQRQESTSVRLEQPKSRCCSTGRCVFSGYPRR
jgi:hypothetical protein